MILRRTSTICIFGVRCRSAHSNQNVLMFNLQIALKWSVLRLTSNWWNLLDECSWVAQQRRVVKLNKDKWSQFTGIYCVLVCIADCSNIQISMRANVTAAKRGVLYLTSEWLSNSWTTVRFMGSIRWGGIVVVFYVHKFYIMAFISSIKCCI